MGEGIVQYGSKVINQLYQGASALRQANPNSPTDSIKIIVNLYLFFIVSAQYVIYGLPLKYFCTLSVFMPRYFGLFFLVTKKVESETAIIDLLNPQFFVD